MPTVFQQREEKWPQADLKTERRVTSASQAVNNIYVKLKELWNHNLMNAQ